MYNNYTFFHQLTPIITDELEKKTKTFIKLSNKDKFEYRDMVKEIRIYKEICQQIPKNVKFPLFYINIEQIKAELITRVDKILEMLFIDLENTILRKGGEINK